MRQHAGKGVMTRQVVTAAREVDAGLAIWIEQNIDDLSVNRLISCPAVTPETLDKSNN